jgi:predicted lipid-binding transport protein (Tim44 family)
VTVSIVILAMVAAFLGMRLYSVLGRRAEHGEEPVKGRVEAKPVSAAAAPLVLPERAANGDKPRELAPMLPSVERGLRDIIAVDRRFDPHGFVDGAKVAYRMVLDAFWRGDKGELEQLCDADVAQSFISAIDARLAAGEVLENRLVRVDEATIVSASYTAPFARVAVRFVADIAAVTRDAEGHVIAGSLNDAVEVRDVWTFRRDVQSAHPDWVLDETDEG